MGMDAELTAFGPFEDIYVKYLDYGPWEYRGVEMGEVVVTTLVTCRTSESSRMLAEALGFGAMDLGKHVFKPTEEQRVSLLRFLMGEDGKRATSSWDEAVDAMARDDRWTFMYRPHG